MGASNTQSKFSTKSNISSEMWKSHNRRRLQIQQACFLASVLNSNGQIMLNQVILVVGLSLKIRFSSLQNKLYPELGTHFLKPQKLSPLVSKCKKSKMQCHNRIYNSLENGLVHTSTISKKRDLSTRGLSSKIALNNLDSTGKSWKQLGEVCLSVFGCLQANSAQIKSQMQPWSPLLH